MRSRPDRPRNEAHHSASRRREGEVVLQATGFGVDYGAFEAVGHVDLTVGRGQVVALIGANGSGKTSVLNGLAAVVASKGVVRLNGRDVSRLPAYKVARAGIRLVPEGRQVFSHLTVEDNLLVAGLKPTPGEHGGPATSLADVLDVFPRLRERGAQLAGTLSGGEQQMLAMARALLGNPSILLLDEPSNGLAPILVQEVFDVLHRLKERGITILIAEQLVADALRMADYAYVLERGRVRIHGRAEEIAADPVVISTYLGGGVMAEGDTTDPVDGA